MVWALLKRSQSFFSEQMICYCVWHLKQATMTFKLHHVAEKHHVPHHTVLYSVLWTLSTWVLNSLKFFVRLITLTLCINKGGIKIKFTTCCVSPRWLACEWLRREGREQRAEIWSTWSLIGCCRLQGGNTFLSIKWGVSQMGCHFTISVWMNNGILQQNERKILRDKHTQSQVIAILLPLMHLVLCFVL